MRCDIRTLTDGPVCFACGNADPDRHFTMKSCRLPELVHPEPYVERASGWQMLLVWGGAAVGGVVFWYMAYRLFVWAVTLPVVYESYSTGECVRVDDPAGVYSCENMPTKFYHEWVQ